MNLDEATRGRIQQLIDDHRVVLFMKGNRQEPRCGFSATVVRLLDSMIPAYHTVDVLEEPDVREGIKEFSSWPTIPQLYVRGEFVGGCDIVQELYASTELHEKLGIETGPAEPPNLTVTDAAARALGEATAGADPEHVLHLAIDARFQSSLFLGPRGADEIPVESNGIALFVDPLTASRAIDATVDVGQTPRGPAFQVHLPNAPTVRQMPVGDLKRRLDQGEALEIFDVRTFEERATAAIDGSVLLDEEQARRIESLPKDSVLVFHCHHGGRSQAAAEHFAILGFTNVWNLVGGIDAWSAEIDPSVPRY